MGRVAAGRLRAWLRPDNSGADCGQAGPGGCPGQADIHQRSEDVTSGPQRTVDNQECCEEALAKTAARLEAANSSPLGQLGISETRG